MRALVKHMSISAILLGGFAVLGSAVVAWIQQETAPVIAHNEQAALLRNLHTLVPPDSHDNELTEDTVQVRNELLGTDKPVTVYRARQNGKPVTAILNVIAPDGYSGNINLLVAIDYDGTLAGVRVLNHRETPGLGDAIEADRSDWIHDFAGKSLGNPDPGGWAVKKDGGVFDQFTGATVSPRAVVRAVHNALKYYADHREQLFRSSNDTTGKTT